jgi:cobalt/nickel transport system permease protein
MSRSTKLFVVAGVLVAIALALLAGPLASSSPDGLEKVAEEEGFDEAADDHALSDTPVADYGGPAPLIGVLLTFGLGAGVFAVIRSRRRDRQDA